MTNPIIAIHNTETNEVIEREMNADELKTYKADQAKSNAEKEAEAQKATAKAELLAKLGITQDEASLLLS
jgi:hypothetical protein